MRVICHSNEKKGYGIFLKNIFLILTKKAQVGEETNYVLPL